MSLELEIRAEKCEPTVLMKPSLRGWNIPVLVQLYNLSLQVPFTYEGELLVVENERFARVRKITVTDAGGKKLYAGPLGHGHTIEEPLLAALGIAAADLLEPPYHHFEQFITLVNGTVTLDPDRHEGKLALEGIVAYSAQRT